MARLRVSLLFALALSACGDSTAADAGPSDAASDVVDADAADTGPACEPLGDFVLAASDGAPDALAAPLSTARAGRLVEAELPADPEGLGDYRAGDFVLSNGRVAFIVSAAESPGQVYDPYGGRLIGLGRVADGAFIEMGDYNLLMLALGRFTVGTEAVAVTNDGTDGGPAVVRVVGRLVPIRALADLLDILVPGDFEGLPAAVDYTLAADTDRLEATLHVRAPEAGIRARLGAIQVFFQANRTQAWRPGSGFDASTAPGPYVAFDDPRGTSFAWRGPEGADVEPLFGTAGVDLFTSGEVRIGPCEEGTLSLGELVAGGPGLPALQRTLMGLAGTPGRSLSGSVANSDGTPASDVRLHLTTGDGAHATRFFPEADGTFSIEVDPSVAELFAYRAGQPLVGPVDASGTTVDLTMPPTGTLSVEVRDDVLGGALPARIEVFPTSGAPPDYPVSFGERGPGRGRALFLFPVDGRASVALLPGDYRVLVTRGPEYEEVEREITVVADSDTSEVVDLARVVPTPGVLCADYHIHTTRSIDSGDPGAMKVASLVADGVEVAIRSEHEWVSDFQPVIEELGLSVFARGFSGLELTTFTWGHFGVFPLTPDRARPSGGAFFWYGRNAPDVFDEVRARPEAPALIINHPRAGGIRQAYFTEAGYDPVTGTVARPELWDETFSLIEVFNASNFEDSREESVRDWFSLLNQGRRVFAVGSSDSHDVRGTPVGWPRTCLRLGTDDPATLTAEQLRDATVSGHSTINGGIYVTVAGPGGVGPGEEASGTGARASFELRLFAAPHVAVDRLEVIVDGETTEVIDILPSDAIDEIERARATIEVDVAPAGSWVVFHASGDAAYDTDGHRSFVVSNPVFLAR